MDRLKKRGLKRRCRNEQCALPFYDLNRDSCACPNCGTAFVFEMPQPLDSRAQSRPGRRSVVAWRPADLPVEQVADDVDVDDVVDVADEVDAEPAGETEVLLETDDEVASAPIEPSSRTATDE